MSATKRSMFSTPVQPNYAKTMNAATLISMYTNTIDRQKDITISELPNLPHHQQVARSHTNTWMTNVFPEMIKVTKDIIGFAQTFDTVYQALTSLINRLENGEEEAKEEFKRLLKVELLPSYEGAAIGRIATKTEAFRQQLVGDIQAFNSDCQTAEDAYNKDNENLQDLHRKESIAQAEIESLHVQLIAAAIKLAALVAAFAVVSIFTFGVGSVGLAAGIAAATETEISLKKSYAGAVQNLHSIQSQIQEQKQEMTMLLSVKNQLKGFQSGTSDASDAAQAVADGWRMLGDDLNELVEKLNTITPNQAAYIIRTELSIAHKDWVQLHSLAKALEPSSQIPVKQYDSVESFLKDITPSTV